MAQMYFTPPTDNIVPPIYIGGERGRDLPSHYADTIPAMDSLMRHFAQRPRGRNVFLMYDGSYSETQPPNWNPNDPTGPIVWGWDPINNVETSTTLPMNQQVRRVYWGGTDNLITAAEVTSLTNAGFGPYIHS